MRDMPGENPSLIKGVQCTGVSSKWGNFRVFYRLSGISLSTHFSTCQSCCWCFSEIDVFFLLTIFALHSLNDWLAPSHSLNWVTDQERHKLWAKYQFQFHLHCIFFPKLMIPHIHTKLNSQAFFSNRPSCFSLTAFCWLKWHKEHRFPQRSVEWIKTSPRTTPLFPSVQEIISHFQSCYDSPGDVWLGHGCTPKEPLYLIKTTDCFISEAAVKHSCAVRSLLINSDHFKEHRVECQI